MARKTEIVRVPDWGKRDAGKIFLLTEWPAARAEKWAMRALLALNRSGGEIPLNIAGIGMQGIAIIGLNTFLRGNVEANEIIPILDELIECVQFIRDPKARDVQTGLPIATSLTSEDDIEEIVTRAWLRSEVLRVHINFSVAEALLKLLSEIMTPAATS
jgi:hypothetical protein